RKRKIPVRQKRGFFSSLESAYTKGALSTFPPPRRLLHSLRIQPRKELSSATLSAPLQAHPSIGKDYAALLSGGRAIHEAALESMAAVRGVAMASSGTLQGNFSGTIPGTIPVETDYAEMARRPLEAEQCALI